MAFETKLAPLSTQVPIVDINNGNPNPFFQQLMQILIDEKNATAEEVSGLSLDNLGDVDLVSSAPEEGDLLYYDGTYWTNLHPGDADQILTTHGAGEAPTWEDAPEGGGGAGNLIYVQTLSPSAAASIDSEAWAGLGYTSIRFVFRLTTSVDGATIGARFKLNGGYKSTGAYKINGASYSSSTSSNQNSSGTGTSIHLGNTGATWGTGNATLEHLAGEAILIKPDETSKPKVLNFNTMHGAPSGAYVSTFGGGTWDSTDYASPVLGVQFVVSSGTFTGSIDVYATTNTIPTPPSPLPGVWSIVGSYDFATHGALATFESSNLSGYSEAMVVFQGVTMASSGWRVANVSVNNGSSYDTTSGSYRTVDTSGAETNDVSFFSHSTSTTAARSGIIHITGINLTMAAKPASTPGRSTAMAIYVGSASPIDKIKAGASTGNMTGGKAWILAR